MSYLIRNGFTDEFVSLDRTDIVPPFERVSIEGVSASWAKITFGLGSLLAVPQVLLAGYLAERMKFAVDIDASPQTGFTAWITDLIPKRATGSLILVGIARELVDGYLGEYDYLYPNVRASDWLEEMMAYGEEVLRKHWVSVESLATALLQFNTLSEVQVAEIIQSHLSAEEAAKARALMEQTVEEKLMRMLQSQDKS